ncbi:ROK family protein [Nocardia sp. CA-145437]|uniref:ROK family protein n=1 Tax=Nocardia sp. CA-145437 TaxID=3239980 RepID=UPI003D9737FA
MKYLSDTRPPAATGTRSRRRRARPPPGSHDRPGCVCGARGCRVTFAGPEAVLDSAGITSLLHDESLQAAQSELLALLRQSEPQALSAMDAAATALGTAILSITALLDIDEVVLGGLLAESACR